MTREVITKYYSKYLQSILANIYKVFLQIFTKYFLQISTFNFFPALVKIQEQITLFVWLFCSMCVLVGWLVVDWHIRQSIDHLFIDWIVFVCSHGKAVFILIDCLFHRIQIRHNCPWLSIILRHNCPWLSGIIVRTDCPRLVVCQTRASSRGVLKTQRSAW